MERFEIQNFLKKYLKNINLKSNADTEILLESYVMAGNKVFEDLEECLAYLFTI